MGTESLSELVLLASIYGKGQIQAKVYKHLAPTTLGQIQRLAPFGGNANFYERRFVYILTPVVVGEEKSRNEFRRKSIAFMPSGSLLCFFMEDTGTYKPMNLLGEIEQGFDLLFNLKPGDTIRVESIKSIKV